MLGELPTSQFIDAPIFPHVLPPDLLHELATYKDTYEALRVPVVQKHTNTEGLQRLLSDKTWHSSRPLSISVGSILAIINDELPASSGENSFFFEVTSPGKLLSPPDAKAEWKKSPFRSESFARRYGYFPYILPDLRPVSRNELMERYFQPPPQELMNVWVSIARSLSARANCYKRKFGAIIVDEGKIVATGTNYTYSGYEKHECELCLRLNIASGTRVEACRAIHAEQDAIVNAVNHNVELLFGIMTVAGQEPDGSPFMNPHFYCTVCSRILREVNGLLGIVTDTKEGARFRPTRDIVQESFQYLEATL